MLELCQILTDFKNSFAVEVLAASARKRSRRLLIFRSRAPVSLRKLCSKNYYTVDFFYRIFNAMPYESCNFHLFAQ